MANEIDELRIKIEAEATEANSAIDVLVQKMNVLYGSLTKLSGVNVTNFAESVNWLASSLRNVAGIDGRTFTALQKNITKLADINPATLSYSATSISDMATSLDKIASSANSLEGVKSFASAISKLGNKNVATATANIPQLATALNQLMVTLSKAPTVNKSVIDMTNALANLAAQGSKVGSASSSVVNGLNRTNAAAKRASGSTMSLARAFGKFYANYFLLVRGFKGMFNMMESAMELTETVNYFEVTLNNIGESARENWKEYGYESADAYSESFAQRLRESNEKLTGFTVSETGQISQSVFSGLGISPATATQYSAMFAQVANSIGMTEEASIALSEAFVRLGADWASLRNVDFEVAYEKLASGLAGQSRALRAFGVDITMASLQEIAFANGIEKSVSEMTQSEKAYLRLIAIIEQSEVAFGDLANTLASPANQMRMLSQGVQNLGTLVGNLFLPILSETLPVLNGFVIALQRIVIAISESMGIDTSGFNTSLGGMDEGFGDLSDSVDEATESAEKFNRATRGWDELNVLGRNMSKGYGVGNDLVENEQLLIAYDEAIEKYRKAWEEAYENINNEAEGFADEFLKNINADKLVRDFNNLSESAKNIWGAFSPLLSGTASGFGNTMFNSLKLLADFAGDITENADPVVMEAVGESIGSIIASILLYKGVSSVTTSFINGIKGIGAALAAHPVLGTFALSAGIITLLTLPIRIDNKKKKAEVEEKFGDMIEVFDLLGEKVEESEKRAEEAKQELKEGLLATEELQKAFDDWESLSSKPVELLTEQEAVLLELYTERLIELLPQAADIINDQALAYDKVIEKVGELMKTEQARLKQQSYENYLSFSYDEEVKLEIDIRDAEKTLDDVVEEFADYLPGIPIEIAEKVLRQSAGELVEDVWGRMGEVRYMENGVEKLYTYDYDKRMSFVVQEYIDATKELEQAQARLDEQKEETQWAVERLAEAQQNYNNVLSDGTEKSKTFQDSVSKTDGIMENLRKKFEETNDVVSSEEMLSTDKVEDFRREIKKTSDEFANLKNRFDSLNNQKFQTEIEITVKEVAETLSKGSILGMLGNLNINLPKYAVGGFPEDGLFMANHNELVGKFSNGKTAVANNDQITKGIEEAAYRGMMRALNQSNGRNSDVNVYLQGDAAGVFKLVQNENSRMKKVTGKSLLA